MAVITILSAVTSVDRTAVYITLSSSTFTPLIGVDGGIGLSKNGSSSISYPAWTAIGNTIRVPVASPVSPLAATDKVYVTTVFTDNQVTDTVTGAQLTDYTSLPATNNTGATMTLAALRTLVLYLARKGKDASEYDSTQTDLMIQQAADIYVRETKATRRLDSVALVANSPDLPTLPTGFLPELLMDAYLTNSSGALCRTHLNVIEYDALLDLQASASTRQPLFMAFANTTAGKVYPTPDQAYALDLWWFQKFDAWTAGADASTVTSFTLSDEHMRIIANGASALLQMNDPQYRDSAQLRYQQFKNDIRIMAARGASGRAPKVLYRDPPRHARRCDDGAPCGD